MEQEAGSRDQSLCQAPAHGRTRPRASEQLSLSAHRWARCGTDGWIMDSCCSPSWRALLSSFTHSSWAHGLAEGEAAEAMLSAGSITCFHPVNACLPPFPLPKWLFPWFPMGVWGWWLHNLLYGCCILLPAPHQPIPAPQHSTPASHHPSPALAMALRAAHRSWLEGLFTAHCLPCQTPTQLHMLQVPAPGPRTCALSPSLYRPNTAFSGSILSTGGLKSAPGHLACPVLHSPYPAQQLML